MIINLPPPPPSYAPSAMAQAFDAIRRALVNVISKDEATPRILLTGSDGNTYTMTITVTNGVPSVTLAANSGKSRI